jgi:multiple sugar transport system permease protein
MVIPQQMLFLSMYLQYSFFDFLGISHIAAAITGQPYTSYTVNLLNSPLTFYIPSLFGVGLRSGLFIYIFRQFFRNVPHELVEAARVDGCGAFKTFLQIMVPIAKATFATIFLFSMVWHWNETTYTGMFFLKAEARPLSTTLGFVLDDMRFSDLFIHNGYNVAQKKVVAYSGTLLYIAPLIALYIFTQRFFVEGIETTGIKG